MNLEPDTEEALGSWMSKSGWLSPHPEDWNRFYMFVDQYQKDHGFSIDESALREIMKRKVKGGYEERIREYVNIAYRILDFLNFQSLKKLEPPTKPLA